ncbi:MAG TPA: ferritin-like domain-containing protein [Solirubrobacterales bacterium]|jgi:bacterioferritin (cytochrome b1)|nr:ferritin-like domain-containing protein [Solirubrobacterales bacterium]
MPDEKEKLDEPEAVERLNKALSLQYRSALQYSLVASSLTGIEAQAIGSKLTDFGDAELADVRRLIEKIVSFKGEPTTDVAALSFDPSARDALLRLSETEEEVIEALQQAIEPTGREGRSEALEHLMEHLILRKQHQVDFLNRAVA